jgi:enoyl-CoA hydratase/carnithine racemase
VSPTLTYADAVAIINLGEDENRWSPAWIDAVEALLDEVVGSPPTALVTTASGKFFTNGLDLEWLTAHPERWGWYVGRVQHLLAKALTLPVPTIAAVNGHAFGAGAMLAMAHDFRIMRADRGYLCLPEVDIHIPFSAGMAALIQAKVPAQTAVAAMTTGRRYGGEDARAASLVDATADESELVDAAVASVAPLVGKDPATLGTIKSTMYAAVVTALAQAAI